MKDIPDIPTLLAAADWGIAVAFAIVIIGYLMWIIRSRDKVIERMELACAARVATKDKEIRRLNKVIYSGQETRIEETKVMVDAYHRVMATIDYEEMPA